MAFNRCKSSAQILRVKLLFRTHPQKRKANLQVSSRPNLAKANLQAPRSRQNLQLSTCQRYDDYNLVQASSIKHNTIFCQNSIKLACVIAHEIIARLSKADSVSNCRYEARYGCGSVVFGFMFDPPRGRVVLVPVRRPKIMSNPSVPVSKLYKLRL